MTILECAKRLVHVFKETQWILPKTLMHGESGILANLRGKENGILSGELSQAMGLSKGRISNVIKELERKGDLTRTAESGDARQVRIRLTEAGEARVKEQYDRVIDSTVRLLTKLGEEDAGTFLRIMEKIASLENED